MSTHDLPAQAQTLQDLLDREAIRDCLHRCFAGDLRMCASECRKAASSRCVHVMCRSVERDACSPHDSRCQYYILHLLDV